jgi:hypothetical protein
MDVKHPGAAAGKLAVACLDRCCVHLNKDPSGLHRFGATTARIVVGTCSMSGVFFFFFSCASVILGRRDV